MSKTEHIKSSLKVYILLDTIHIKTSEEYKYIGSVIHQDKICTEEN